MKRSSLTARQLRIILFIALILLFAGVSAGFIYAQENLHSYAVQISKLNADANSGDQNLQTLKTLKQRLAKEQDTIQKAHSVVANSATYSDEVIEQLTKIARESNVSITSIDFATTSTTPTATVPSAASPPSVATSPSPVASTGAIQSKAVTVALDSPLPYNNLMNFLKNIETNTLQMQVEGISLSKDKDASVSTPALIIKVYVR